ncbi:hypothetical protein Enr13x_53600 [Stieleria neptunia]|uniref:RHS Repeat protein n=1 Tax=Stieleria neptunia TaxID=2527979 RepID=A0A518HXB3_9BACT|nr:hypothetical protein Enr13x_53600 [Stieleria neptunia]
MGTESANSVEQLETDYAYDLQGRVADHSVVDASTGNSITTDYDYDALGRLDTQRTPTNRATPSLNTTTTSAPTANEPNSPSVSPSTTTTIRRPLRSSLIQPLTIGPTTPLVV